MTFRSRVEVWLIDLKRDGNAFARMADRDGVLTPADRRRLHYFRQPADALAFAASRAGLRQVLQWSGGTANTHLHRTRSGQPFVPGHAAISVSHTHSHVAIATNPGGPVGVDIETTGRRVQEYALISRVAALLSDGSPQNYLPIAAWTVIEAWTKVHGLALADVLDSAGRRRELEAAMETTASNLGLALLVLPAGLVGACWYEGRPASITVRELEPTGEQVGSHSYPKALV